MNRTIAATIACLAFAGVTHAQDCDWKVISDRIDPMSDQRTCIIRSESARIAIAVRGSNITFLTSSAYRHGNDGLMVRIDENPAIFIGENRSTAGFEDRARRALDEIMVGSRIRTSFRDYPASQEGSAPICTLPSLIEACSS